MFLKLGDIKGESQDAKHKGEIELLSWSWGISQAGGFHTGTGGGVGKASFADLSVTHRLDKASPNLMMACASGQHIKDGLLTQRKAGKDQQEFLTFKLADIIVTGVQPAGHDGDSGPMENVSLNFGKVEMEYKAQKADGTLDASVKFVYDIEANKAG
jgi:type VI secretion system secreted protein Hcp